MTRLLLSASDKLKKQTAQAGHASMLRNVFNFFYAVQALRLLTFVWLYWTLNKYHYLLLRPKDLFWYDHTLPNLVMPSLPSPTFFYIVTALLAACNLHQLLVQKNKALLQAVLALSLLWLNLALWGYGFLSHINHLFLLAHLFLIFIPISKETVKSASLYLHKSINWFYAGLLFTYTLAGLWKIPSLLYKLITNSSDIHWLHPQASLVNAIVSFRSLDLAFPLAPLFTEYALFWQIAFLTAVYLQISSIFAAFRQPLRPWIGFSLLVFHTLNMLVFQIYFVVASLTIACLFFPYNLLFRQAFRNASGTSVNSMAQGSGLNSAPAATPFTRFREKLSTSSFYCSGLLYLPGIRTLSNFIFNTFGKS